MKESGQMIKQMVKVSMSTTKELPTQEVGSTTCNMVMELRHGMVGGPDMREISLKERKMEKEDSSGKMEATTMETS